MSTDYEVMAQSVSNESSCEGKIALLKKWCEEHITSNLPKNTHDKKELEILTTMAREYHNFLEVNSNLTEAQPKLRGLTPLEYAAKKGYSVFLNSQSEENCAWVNPKTGKTLVHLAAAHGQLTIVQTLLGKKVRGDKADNNANLPIHQALVLTMVNDAEMAAAKKEIYKLLLEMYPETKEKVTNDKQNIVHLIAIASFEELLDSFITENSSLLVGKNIKGQTPLHVAVLNHKVGVFNKLVNVKGLVGLKDDLQRSVVHYVAAHGTADMINKCLEADASLLDSMDSEGYTPAMLAVKHDNLETLKALIDNGANVENFDKNGRSLLLFESENKNNLCMAFLRGSRDSSSQLKRE